MAKSKRKSGTSSSKAKAKRQKVQKKDDAPPILTMDEKILKMNEHLNMCVARVNLLLEHTQFVQSRMAQLANLTQRELNKINLQIQDLMLECRKTREDSINFCPEFEGSWTLPQTPLCSDDGEMSEEALIKAVGGFADALP